MLTCRPNRIPFWSPLWYSNALIMHWMSIIHWISIERPLNDRNYLILLHWLVHWSTLTSQWPLEFNVLYIEHPLIALFYSMFTLIIHWSHIEIFGTVFCRKVNVSKSQNIIQQFICLHWMTIEYSMADQCSRCLEISFLY